MPRFISMRLSLFVHLLCILPVFTFCQKTDGYWDAEEAESAYEQFNDLYQSSQNSEAFLFFSDPHLLSGESKFTSTIKQHIDNSFGIAKTLYDALPLSFCLCGGDWLNQRDSQEMAKEKLLYADRLMKKTFSRYYKMMGNHDTNYQGYVSNIDTQRGDLPREFIDNEYFSDTGSAYYAFDGENTRFYILDSGLDWDTAMDEYRWEQILWLAEQLETNDVEHITIGIHMFYNSDIITPMSELLVQLCEAYNSKQSITFNTTAFDFAKTNGKIHMILSGHSHKDGINFEGKDCRIPVVRICNYTINGSQSFDLCLLDYDKEILYMIRLGEGENRDVNLN